MPTLITKTAKSLASTYNRLAPLTKETCKNFYSSMNSINQITYDIIPIAGDLWHNKGLRQKLFHEIKQEIQSATKDRKTQAAGQRIIEDIEAQIRAQNPNMDIISFEANKFRSELHQLNALKIFPALMKGVLLSSIIYASTGNDILVIPDDLLSWAQKHGYLDAQDVAAIKQNPMGYAEKIATESVQNYFSPSPIDEEKYKILQQHNE